MQESFWFCFVSPGSHPCSNVNLYPYWDSMFRSFFGRQVYGGAWSYHRYHHPLSLLSLLVGQTNRDHLFLTPFPQSPPSSSPAHLCPPHIKSSLPWLASNHIHMNVELTCGEHARPCDNTRDFTADLGPACLARLRTHTLIRTPCFQPDPFHERRIGRF